MCSSGDDIPSDERRSKTVPSGRDPVRVAVFLMALVVVVGAVTYLGPILKPFLVAVFLYFSTKAATGFLIRLRVPASLTYLTLFVAGSAATAALVLLTYDEAISLQAEWPRYQQRVLDLIGRVPRHTSRPLADMFTTSSREVFKYVFERGVDILELLTMTFFYLLFILLGAGRLPQRVLRAFPDGRGEHLLCVAGKIGAAMEQFMQVKTLASAGLGVSAAALMYFFGLSGWLLWGILFFAFNYITGQVPIRPEQFCASTSRTSGGL